MRTEVFFSATCPQNKLSLRTSYPFSSGSQSLPALPGGKLLFLLDAKVNKKQDALKEAGSAGNAQADEGIMENRFLVAASQPDDKRKEAADNQADNNLYNQEGPLVFIQFHFG